MALEDLQKGLNAFEDARRPQKYVTSAECAKNPKYVGKYSDRVPDQLRLATWVF